MILFFFHTVHPVLQQTQGWVLQNISQIDHCHHITTTISAWALQNLTWSISTASNHPTHPQISSLASQGSNQWDASNTRVPQASPLLRILQRPYHLAHKAHIFHMLIKGQVIWFLTPPPSPLHLDKLISCHSLLAYSTPLQPLWFFSYTQAQPCLLVFIHGSV